MPRIDQTHATAPPAPPAPTIPEGNAQAALVFMCQRYFQLRQEAGKRAGVKDARDYDVDCGIHALQALEETLEAIHRHSERQIPEE
jgi:hypothetical protein